MNRNKAAIIAIALLAPAAVAAAVDPALLIPLKVTGQADGVNVPVCVKLAPSAAMSSALAERRPVQMRCASQKIVTPGQLVRGADGPELWWILPKVSAGTTCPWTATIGGAVSTGESFRVADTPGKHLDVLLGKKKVTRYMYQRDAATPERAHETYKVYNHVFDETGKDVITKGPGGKFTHHRGIFIGWSKLGFGGKRYDTWHMKTNIQEHKKFLPVGAAAGPVLARYTAEIHWNDKTAGTLLTEQRQITVYRQPATTVLLLDFRSKLTAGDGEVELNGDPEHAGCQYRPHNDVASGKPKPSADKAVKYLFHKDGVTPQKVKDLPWAAMAYSLRGKRYQVQHMSGPGIPKGNTYSAYRDYGRFGAFCRTTIPAGKTLVLNYRYYVGTGPMQSREKMAARYAAFATPPKVEVVKVAPCMR